MLRPSTRFLEVKRSTTVRKLQSELEQMGLEISLGLGSQENILSVGVACGEKCVVNSTVTLAGDEENSDLMSRADDDDVVAAGTLVCVQRRRSKRK